MGRRCRGGEELIRRMKLIFELVTVFFAFASFPAAAQSGRTFYIDYASGSNGNSGASKSAPWKTHPYMQITAACTGGSAPAYSHQAGDHFVFKGGVAWPAACFQMTIQAGGTSSAQDYYGVDQTWFTGASFTRPIFDLQQQVPAGASSRNAVVYGNSHVTFDNFEVKNQAIATNTLLGATAAFDFYGSSCGDFVGAVVKNSYIHDFMTNSTISSSFVPQYEAGGIIGCGVTVDHVTIDDTNGFGFNATGNKVFEGIGGTCVNCQEVKNSRFIHTMGACFTVPSCHDSEFTGIMQAPWDTNTPTGFAPLGTNRPHTQVIED